MPAAFSVARAAASIGASWSTSLAILGDLGGDDDLLGGGRPAARCSPAPSARSCASAGCPDRSGSPRHSGAAPHHVGRGRSVLGGKPFAARAALICSLRWAKRCARSGASACRRALASRSRASRRSRSDHARRQRRIIRLARVLGGVDRFGLGEHVVDQRIQLGQRAVAIRTGVGADLRPVQRDRAESNQPGLGAQPQRLDEHRRERVCVPGPEPRERHVIRASAHRPAPGTPRLPGSAARSPARTAPRSSTRTTTPRPAPPGHTPPAMPISAIRGTKPRQVQLIDHVDHEPRQMIAPAANPAYPAATRTPDHDRQR